MASPRKLFTKLFWLDATERAIVTFGEALLGFLVAGAAFEGITWGLALSVSGVATLASVIKSVVAAAKADTDTASLVVDSKPLESK